jgi:hypothetical protein
MINSAPFQLPVEGAFAYLPPIGIRFNALYPQITSGPGGQLVAATGGLIMGRFGWADIQNTGTATNTRVNSTDRLGFVAPQYGSWQKVYQAVSAANLNAWFLRAGLPAVMYARGGFWARFAGAAQPSQPVYASLIDGSCISGYAADAELTPWFVNSPCGPGELAIINTWSNYP